MFTRENSSLKTNIIGRIKEKLSIKAQGIRHHKLSNESETEYHNQNTTREDPKTLSWVNITVKTTLAKRKHRLWSCCGLEKNKETKIILNNVSGIAKAQSLLAIIGSSGSGKTTLLNCLTQRNLGSLEVEGCILVNGKHIGEDIYRISDYVQQDNVFIGTLTVKEHLWFNAMLRLDKRISCSEKMARVEEIMTQMSLKKCEDTTIGYPGSMNGISGGEKKRLAFSEKLFAKPSIMFCDEPTSGLDSFGARNVIEALRDLASIGHTVLATIHQPSSEVFAMFDEILIIAEGRVAFLGSTNDALKFFSGLRYYCPNNYNISDFLMNTLAIVPGEETMGQEKIARICNYFEESTYFSEIKHQIQVELQVDTNISDIQVNQIIKDIFERDDYKTSWWVQLRMCLWRSYTELMRMKVFHAKYIYIMFMSVLVGTLYWRQSYTSTGVDNINAALYTMVIQILYHISYVSAMRCVEIFPVLLKEHYDRQYSISALCLANFVIEILFAALQSFIYILAIYWMIGLYPTPGTFFTMVAAVIIFSFTGVVQGHLWASIFLDPEVVFAFLTFSNHMQLLFTGFLIKPGFFSIFKIIQVICSSGYAFQILVVSQWKNIKYLQCESTYKIDHEHSNIDTRLNQDNSALCFHNGREVLESFGYDTDSIGYCFGMMIVLIIVIEVISYVALIFKLKRAK